MCRRALDDEIQTINPGPCPRICGRSARITRWVDIVELGQLFGRERLSRAERHVLGIMDDHVEVPNGVWPTDHV